VTEHLADRLLAAIEGKAGPVCVGLDPVAERLPPELQPSEETPAARLEAIGRFCDGVLEAVAPIVPAVKLQSAYFEAYRQAGVELYFRLVERARGCGLIVIGDVKRNDIGSTAEAYAAAHLAGPGAPDAITVNAYFGADGLGPFVRVARQERKGVFVIVRTSNPSAGQVQDFADASGSKLHEHLAEQVAATGAAEDLLGERGYSCVGAVVAATYPQEASRLRELMPQQVFLVPGFGAQGATGEDCAAAFHADGTGAIVNASRSVIYAHGRPQFQGTPWTEAIGQAARDFAAEVRAAIGGTP